MLMLLRKGGPSDGSVSIRARLVSISGSHGLLNCGTHITIGKPAIVYAALITV